MDKIELDELVNYEVQMEYLMGSYIDYTSAKDQFEFFARKVLQKAGVVVTDGCDKPPKGWVCTREKNHTGPCAAHCVSLSPIGNTVHMEALSHLKEAVGALEWWIESCPVYVQKSDHDQVDEIKEFLKTNGVL